MLMWVIGLGSVRNYWKRFFLKLNSAGLMALGAWLFHSFMMSTDCEKWQGKWTVSTPPVFFSLDLDSGLHIYSSLCHCHAFALWLRGANQPEAEEGKEERLSRGSRLYFHWFWHRRQWTSPPLHRWSLWVKAKWMQEAAFLCRMLLWGPALTP